MSTKTITQYAVQYRTRDGILTTQYADYQPFSLDDAEQFAQTVAESGDIQFVGVTEIAVVQRTVTKTEWLPVKRGTPGRARSKKAQS